MTEDWKNQIDNAEKQWKEEKQKALYPFDFRKYLQATQKYQERMKKATFEALTKGNE